MDPDWKPIEYLANGRPQGLVPEYLKRISQRTGLRFEPVDGSGWGQVTEKLARGEIDVLPAALRAFTTPAVAKQVTFTRNYYIDNTVVITRSDGLVAFDLHSLNGRIVALKGQGAYQAKVHAQYPNLQILPTRTPEDALDAVALGRADAALGSGVAMLPYLRRKYLGTLSVSGVVGNMPMELAMGVRNDLPTLRSILDKALASFGARETDEMVEHWFESTDYGAPSLSVLMRHYGPQLALMTIGLVLITSFALHARRQRLLAQQSEKEKTMFLAVLSHEIRSPMNAILASMELLQQRAELPAESQRLLNVASGGAENLLRLLDDVLDISKLEAGRLHLDLEPVDMVELARTVTDLLAVAAQDKGITLTLQVEGLTAPRLMLDRLRVGQILHNLASNAVKFTSRGGVTVILDFSLTPTSPSRGWLEIRVADTGIGMDASTRQRLFEPYVQASAATARKFGGTGLGLAICRQLVELMGGTIDVASDLGHGSVVTVRLPCDTHVVLATSMARSSSLVDTEARAAGRQIEVLLVEDTPANQMVFQAQLQLLGCRATLAADGFEALDALDKARFDIVLLDCDLPGLSGYEVARRWRETESSRGIAPTPIVAISASTDTGHTAACFDAGMDGVLKKPIKLGKLRDAMQLWTDVVMQSGDEASPLVMDSQAALTSIRADVTALQAAVKERDVASATHYAHRLVGACDVMSFSDISSIARTLEAGFKSEANLEVHAQIMQLEQLLHQYAQTLSTARKSES